ncbi:hypothetical protein F4780DRAFT_778248 [Xylariomycetidae sp. FL0641]|nr:hypothetical protein F4780DRAFT_778248 [Xylariomycetidae sp. FL0641]
MTAYQDINWTGASLVFTVETQTQCYQLDGTDWSDTIDSIQVNTGFHCRLWSSNHCNGDSSPDIYAPGTQDLATFKNKATSFKCYENN